MQVKIAKSDGSCSTPSIQFTEANEYPVVFKWHGGSQTKANAKSSLCGHTRILQVFDALDRDLASSNAGEAMRKVSVAGAQPPSHDTPNDRELEKLKQFTQEAPDRRDFEKTQNPPVLPPHLLQVILNKDTPVQCDPNVLPEPNHVMLNHLYALSIKDGVMVLSATHRYRKKYVTTLLYKPI
uniref:Association with the SNF1 complex (ASC) domain-containing protein n=1 Tax=Parascaris equorum TaxID=6256 RepID=A0A914SC82_PAREQ